MISTRQKMLLGLLAPLGKAGGSASVPAITAGIAATLGQMNDVANPLMLGGVAGTDGSGGFLPDLWTKDFSDTAFGMNPPVYSYGIENGFPYVDTRIFGTPTIGAAGRMQIVYQKLVEGAAQARANAVNLKLAAGSLTNCAVNTFVNCSDTANSYISTLGFGARSITGTSQKFPFTYTTPALTGFVDAAFSVSYTPGGGAVDITVRHYLPQDERGATTHDLLISTPANDGFFSRAIPATFFGSHTESPGAGGEPFPFTNGPATVLVRGTSFNPERRWVDLINPSNGVYVWTTVDAWFALMSGAGMIPSIPMFTGDQKPSWVGGTATNPTTASIQAFITAFLTRYASQLKVIEGINEVDGGVFWTGTKAQAVSLQQFIYTTAKALNPNLIVLGPSTTGAVTGIGYMRDLLALGIDAYYDVPNYHSYNQGRSYTPEMNLAINMAHLAMYRRFSTSGSKPLWDSEGSFAHPPAINSANKIDFLIKQGLLAISAGTEKSIWYATDNATYGTLWDATNGYNDTATALKILRAWTTGATPTGPATFVVNQTNTQWSMDFTRGAYTARVLWSTAGGTYTVPAGYTQYRDTNGNCFKTSVGNTLTLSDLPILLESDNTLGTIIRGYILDRPILNKTIWDIDRDGALPAGTYTALPIQNTQTAPKYYVSTSGTGSGNGLSSAAPWTLAQLNAATLSPGDLVGLKGGDTFSSTLTLTNSGTLGSPIKITSYGTGQATISVAINTDAVAGTNLSYIWIDNLNLVSAGGTTAGAGVNLTTNTGATSSPIVSNCNVSGFPMYGVHIIATGSATINLPIIFGCAVTGCTFGLQARTAGIMIEGGTINQGSSFYPITRARIEGSTSKNNTGASGQSNWTGTGIYMGQTNVGLIQNCTADNNGVNSNNTAGPTGIWTSAANLVTIQYCESKNTKTASGDGGGFDMDGGTTNCTTQFCYSHGNAGFGFMCFQFDSAAWTANSNNTLRYNVSFNDVGGGIRVLSGGSSANGGQIHNNIVTTNSGSSQPLRIEQGGGALTYVIANNIINVTANSPQLITTSGNPTGCTVVGNDYNAASFKVTWNGTAYTALATWQAATGQEKISGSSVALTASPVFLGTGPSQFSTNMEPYRLNNTSTILNAGVNLTSNYSITNSAIDYFGNPTTGDWTPGIAGIKSALSAVILTATGNQTIPPDFKALYAVETIAAGGSSNGTGTGAGGGAYARTTAPTLTPGQIVPYTIGAAASGANGGDTFWNASSLANAVTLGAGIACGAQGGSTNSAGAGGAGGLASASVGTLRYSGGTGGSVTVSVNGGGGGAGGSFGPGGNGGAGGSTGSGAGGAANSGNAGGNGGASSGAGGAGPYGAGGAVGSPAGGNGTQGAGGGGGTTTGGAGGAGVDWIVSGTSYGAGGGGGAGQGTQAAVNIGGAFGGGAGGRNAALGGVGGIRFLYKIAANI